MMAVHLYVPHGQKYTTWNKFSKQAGFKILNYWFPIMEQFIKLPRPPLKIFSKEQVHLYYIKSQFICQFSLYTFGEGFQYWRIFSIKGVGVVGTSQIRQKKFPHRQFFWQTFFRQVGCTLFGGNNPPDSIWP